VDSELFADGVLECCAEGASVIERTTLAHKQFDVNTLHYELPIAHDAFPNCSIACDRLNQQRSMQLHGEQKETCI
jgi:hypothetical protein